MPPDPPSHSMLRMHSMLCTLKTDNDVVYVPLWPYHSKLLATALLIRRIKKPVLNPTLTLTLVLRAKHNYVFHCLYEGVFLVSLRRSRVGPASPGRSLQPLLTSNSPKTYLIRLVCLIEDRVTGELLGQIPTMP